MKIRKKETESADKFMVQSLRHIIKKKSRLRRIEMTIHVKHSCTEKSILRIW